MSRSQLPRGCNVHLDPYKENPNPPNVHQGGGTEHFKKPDSGRPCKKFDPESDGGTEEGSRYHHRDNRCIFLPLASQLIVWGMGGGRENEFLGAVTRKPATRSTGSAPKEGQETKGGFTGKKNEFAGGGGKTRVARGSISSHQDGKLSAGEPIHLLPGKNFMVEGVERRFGEARDHKVRNGNCRKGNGTKKLKVEGCLTLTQIPQPGGRNRAQVICAGKCNS